MFGGVLRLWGVLESSVGAGLDARSAMLAYYDYSIAESGSAQWNESGYVRVANATNPGGEPVYAAMKAAVAHFTTSLAATVGRDGLRVNGVGPDLTQTPQVDYISRSEGHEDLWESWAPVGRLGWPTDQARVALFLASDMSSFVTGHNIPVDGGTLAGGRWFFSPKERRFVNRSKNL